MIKLIVSDIDETLIRADQSVPERNIKAIEAAKDKGLIVMLATGRGPYEIFDIPKDAGVIGEDRFLICCNGAVIMDLENGDYVDVLDMDFDYARKVFDFCYENDLTFYLYTLDKKYGINVAPSVLSNEKNLEIIDSDNIDFLKDDTILKMIIRKEDMNFLQALEVDVARLTNYDLEISYSSNMYMEMNAKGVDKSVALKKVCAHYGIDIKDVLAIGDNYNDVAMLREAGTSVAVKNARLQVKETAGYVTTATNDKGAVGEAIEKFVLNL